MWRVIWRPFSLALVLSFVFLSQTLCAKNKISSDDGWSMTPGQLLVKIKCGWNLGNTLEAATATNYETNWGAPVTTQAMIDAIRAKGFGAIRIPISYSKTVDKVTLKIPAAQLLRLKQVVNYCLKDHLFVIIDSHHDNAANDDYCNFYDMGSKYRTQTSVYTKAIWKQIAEYFKDVDYHLIFEGFNEPLASKGETEGAYKANMWSYDASNEADNNLIKNVMAANQIFVNTVRATGGNNYKRFLMVPATSANSGYTLSALFDIPKDSCRYPNHILVSVHDYAPDDMSLNGTDSVFRENSAEVKALGMRINGLGEKFSKRGIGVIMGEWATCNMNNTAQRMRHAAFYVSTAARNGIPCFWWDNHYQGYGADKFCIFDRTTLKWLYPGLAETIVSHANVVDFSKKNNK
jgi:endoglucanase